jgi:carboxymethylenebutenolidase
VKPTLSIIAVMLALVSACEDDKPAPLGLGSASSAVSPTTSVSAAPTARAPTGILSEEDFKALHVLRDDAAPPPAGEGVALASSKAYLSLPKNAKPPMPAIVVIHEWWGLNEHIKHWADRLAAAGYAALAVDLYGGEVATDPDGAMKLMKAVDDEVARKVLLDAFSFVKEDARIKANKRGAIGWCFGGKWSLELALAAPELDAAVIYYGHVESDPSRLAKLEAPLLAIFGNQDEGIPPKMVDAFEFGLEQAGGKQYKLLRYDAKHAFANPSSGRYDDKAASAAWAEVRGFFAKELATKN